ncbi:hypothetical protein [Pseudaestuariivita atlantica]|uniref:Uncharacterized protein n=1 Tax=Pseudaestuariivita atlantica TaxID=1317121 RepID=A0A0L1JQA3_9RHOB|nr:hypothetical protein [Pseudaestuariivita atlantica]KNG93593.1 hypothetical protein ATO11_10290 [Pseudaestuariivita atlantica]
MSLTNNWDGFLEAVRDGVVVLAKNTVNDAVSQAQNDAQAFIAKTETRLKRWGDALADGVIDLDDFEFLVGGQRDLAQLHALKAIGLAKAQLERFRQGLISLIVTSASEAVGL